MANKIDKWPPQLSADRAFEIIDKIYRGYGKSVNVDLLPDILDASRKSSYFTKRLIALQSFGLANVRKGVLVLTPLAEKVVAPLAENEKIDAKIESIRSIEILKDMLDRYPGGHLPEDAMLGNLIRRVYQVPENSSGAWVEFVKKSIDATKSIAARILDEPGITAERAVDKLLDQERSSSQRAIDLNQRKLDEESMLRVPLSGSRYILIPRDLTEKEAGYFTQWFEMWKGLHDENGK